MADRSGDSGQPPPPPGSAGNPDYNPYAPPPQGPARNPEYNPYAPPSATLTTRTAATPDDAVAIRRELLKHETSVRSIGTLYMFGFVVLVIGAVGMVIVAAMAEQDTGVFLALVVLYGLLAWLNYYLGTGLRRLDRKVRGLVTLFAVIGLIGFPIGTLINGYILYLLHSDKGKRVMTPEYQAIIAQTPHIQYKTPVWLIAVVVVVLVVIVLAIVAAVAG